MSALPKYEPIFKDGDDDTIDSYIENIIIQVKENGFVVTLVDEEGEESHVFVKGRDDLELINFIRDNLGLN